MSTSLPHIYEHVQNSLILKRQLNTTEMFQVKIDNNANLILIWPHDHFQQNVKVLFAKNTGVETLKMCYWYAVIRFVCGSGSGTWSPQKCATEKLSTNLFLV